MYDAEEFHDLALCRVRALNDEIRRHFTDGRIVFSRGIATLPVADQAEILDRVRTFEEFTADNDPYTEHDFGAFEYGSQRICWKIDYYDAEMEFGSEDPADPSNTTRVLTIMLAEEY